MTMNLFQEISRTNRAYCASLGLDCDAYDRPLADAEANGTPLSAAEIEVADHMRRHGINRRAAEMFVALNGPAKPLTWNPRTADVPAPHAVVEYARSRSLWDQKNIQPYYDECRTRSGQRAGVWVGD
jgi:hypothetical protein